MSGNQEPRGIDFTDQALDAGSDVSVLHIRLPSEIENSQCSHAVKILKTRKYVMASLSHAAPNLGYYIFLFPKYGLHEYPLTGCLVICKSSRVMAKLLLHSRSARITRSRCKLILDIMPAEIVRADSGGHERRTCKERTGMEGPLQQSNLEDLGKALLSFKFAATPDQLILVYPLCPSFHATDDTIQKWCELMGCRVWRAGWESLRASWASPKMEIR